VGQKGVRIQAVMEEINGERVDMLEWSEDPIKLISTALQPAAISAVIIVNDQEQVDADGRRIKKRAAVFVEEAQRPMAIGKKGQNIRLATELTGYELDMYNYEELPAFKAKLAELRGDESLPENDAAALIVAEAAERAEEQDGFVKEADALNADVASDKETIAELPIDADGATMPVETANAEQVIDGAPGQVPEHAPEAEAAPKKARKKAA
jgi:N utilization substance protein A